MMHHPSIRGRQLVLVGAQLACRTFAHTNGIDPNGVILVDHPRYLIGRTPEDIHIVVMSHVLDWSDPNAQFLRTALAFLQRKGATLEWA